MTDKVSAAATRTRWSLALSNASHASCDGFDALQPRIQRKAIVRPMGPSRAKASSTASFIPVYDRKSPSAPSKRLRSSRYNRLNKAAAHSAAAPRHPQSTSSARFSEARAFPRSCAPALAGSATAARTFKARFASLAPPLEAIVIRNLHAFARARDPCPTRRHVPRPNQQSAAKWSSGPPHDVNAVLSHLLRSSSVPDKDAALSTLRPS